MFHIPQEYENLLSQQLQSLHHALAVQWRETRFSVQYGTLEQTTPYMMQNVRKEKAYQRAAELLQQEPAVQKLIELFDAEIQNIQLKP